jgi:hypothetical protein
LEVQIYSLFYKVQENFKNIFQITSATTKVLPPI